MTNLEAFKMLITRLAIVLPVWKMKEESLEYEGTLGCTEELGQSGL